MQRGLPFDALDSRVVLFGYAVITAPAGLLVALTALTWPDALSGLSSEQQAVVGVAGAIASSAGFIGLAFSQIGSPVERRRALLWFIIAHVCICIVLTVLLVFPAIDTSPSWRDTYTTGLFVSGAGAIWLFSGWWRQAGDPEPLGAYMGLFGQRPVSGTERVRSQYEQQIRLFAAQEERNRLARDLHDSVKQQVFAIQTAAATAETRLATDPAGARTALAQVRESARDSMAELDALLDQLQAAPLGNSGLVDVIRRQCEGVRLRTGADVTCDIGTLPPSAVLPPGTHQALSRVTQEALSNTARHARATKVRVALDRVGSSLQLTVSDNGSGYDAGTESVGMGLRNIRARAEELGGEAHIGSKPGEGTTVIVTLPFADADPRHYLKRALLWLAIFAFFAVTTFESWDRGRGRATLLIMVPVILDTVRYLLAWQRARKLRSAWT